MCFAADKLKPSVHIVFEGVWTWLFPLSLKVTTRGVFPRPEFFAWLDTAEA